MASNLAKVFYYAFDYVFKFTIFMARLIINF